MRESMQKASASLIIIGDFLVPGLRRHIYIWKKYFLNLVDLCIGGNWVQHILWGAGNIDIPKCT